MHFSSPSGHRLSWWWPWNRGAVGRLSSGYITVSAFRNISRKVTPNPLTGLRKSSTGDLLSGFCVAQRPADRNWRRVTKLETVVVRQVQRRHGEALGRALFVLIRDGRRLGRQVRGAPLGRVVPERDQREDQHQDQAGADVHDGRVAVVAPGLDRGDQQN